MERVQVLIDRLTEQKKAGDTAAQLLLTVQLLQQELVLQQQQTTNVSSKKVSVIMPAPAINFLREDETPQPAAAIKPIEKTPVIVPPAEPPKPAADMPKETVAPVQSYTLRRPSITELLQERGEQKEPAPVESKPVAPAPVHFDMLEETPTLLQHTPQEEKKIHKEINQIIHGQQRSLNDQLKEQRPEVAHLLQETPVKDLRRAIGINDKFVFLAELFNGDEATYERSIKTINNFHVLQEAEYWMNRELKLRLGWNDTAETVQHFYQLVRRRFS